MKIRIQQLFVFWLAFHIEVSVDAKDLKWPINQDPVQLPSGCYENDHIFPCALMEMTGKSQVRVSYQGVEISLAPDAAIQRVKRNESRHVAGKLLIETEEGEHIINYPSGKIILSSNSSVLLERADRITLQVLRGHAEVELIDGSKKFEVQAGLQMWIGKVNKTGKVELGFFEALSSKPALTSWASLTSLPKADFFERVSESRDVWGAHIEGASKVVQQAVERTIANHDRRLAEQKRREEERKKEEMFLKNHFLLKVFEIP